VQLNDEHNVKRKQFSFTLPFFILAGPVEILKCLVVLPCSPFISSFKRLVCINIDNQHLLKMSFPTKSERSKCWTSRDELWKCLDENPDSHEVCSKFRALYESSCPSQWVKHFDRKREYLKFKDRIQNEGYEAVDSRS